MSSIADNDLKDTHLTPEDTENIANELSKLQDTYKAAIKSANDYKHKMDRELGSQKQTNWELDHQTKRMTEYGPKIAKAKVDITALKQHLANVGESCLAIISCHPNVNNDFFTSQLVLFTVLFLSVIFREWLQTVSPRLDMD